MENVIARNFNEYKMGWNATVDPEYPSMISPTPSYMDGAQAAIAYAKHNDVSLDEMEDLGLYL